MDDAQDVTGAAAPEFERYHEDGKLRWRHVESGRTGWVISGGSDTMAPTGAEPAEPVEAVEPAEPAPSAEPDPYEGWDIEKFKAEHAKLKQENVAKKERFRPIEQAFEGADPQDVQQYLTFVQLLRSGDEANVKRAAEWMRTNLDAMSPVVAEAVQDAADAASKAAGGDDDFDPFDPEAIAKLVEEKAAKLVDERLSARDRQRQEAEQREKIVREMDEFVSGLGDKLGLAELKDSASEEYGLLFVVAQQMDQNMPWQERLSAAAERVQSMFAKHGQQYMKAKSAEAGAPAAPPEGGAPSGQKSAGSIREASASAMERLGKIQQLPGTP